LHRPPLPRLEPRQPGHTLAACRAHGLRRASALHKGCAPAAETLAKLASTTSNHFASPSCSSTFSKPKNPPSILVEAAQRGEDVVIANRGKPVVQLVKLEPMTRRRLGAWAGLMADAEIDCAFPLRSKPSWHGNGRASIDRPIDAGVKAQPKVHKAARKTVRRRRFCWTPMC
jgi:antitoxin (DNA-binding transcriptional repressor) of toxin-antitoxin stability system